MSAGLLGTGIFIAAEVAIFIAAEVDRPLGELPDRVAVSVITLSELALGVRTAPDADFDHVARAHADLTVIRV